MPPLIFAFFVSLTIAGLTGGADITLDHPGMKITADARIAPGAYRLPVPGIAGAVLIRGDDVTVDFQGAKLIGCEVGQAPDGFTGAGLLIEGSNITVRNLSVRGYKIGIHARRAPGLVLEDADVSGNYCRHLRSTPQSEDVSDWIYPHENDDGQWAKHYGAGVYIERSAKVTVRRVQARRGQNGIVLDRVDDAQIYDNDCSFLSGWGLALWRSSDNVITRNAFDFCIRGYSHGVYNRGQDSAGILMFEQCNRNLVAENSATHCGDGFFGFGGQASLAGDRRTGNNANLLINNDFSYAAAHGIEMTFSFDNRFIGNRLVGNAICGVWAGYSQDTLIDGNTIEDNGQAGYGLEGGGINIEHGSGNRIVGNRFARNSCGVYLWWDDDAELLKKPWCRANEKGSRDHLVAGNIFHGDRLGLRLRRTTDTVLHGNVMTDVRQEVDSDEGSAPTFLTGKPDRVPSPEYSLPGSRTPVGSRVHLRGRQNILMTEWGPYDFSGPLITPSRASGGTPLHYRLLGGRGSFEVLEVVGAVAAAPRCGPLPGTIVVSSPGPGLHPFALRVRAGGREVEARGTLLDARWSVAYFAWDADRDPRGDPANWTMLTQAPPLLQVAVPEVNFRWGASAPADGLPHDHFATVARATATVPAGSYRLRTVSDDGIRVWVDHDLVIDDWTWHPPKTHEADVVLTAGPHHFRIEHFEIDGYAWLQFQIDSIE